MKNKALTDKKAIHDIIRRCQWCHVAMVDNHQKPYVIPMNFGFREDIIFLHGAGSGKKINILNNHPEVCIHFSTDHLLRYQNENVACSWSMKYRSVLAYGKVEFIEEDIRKAEALHVIMSQYSTGEFRFNPPSIREVKVMQVKVEMFEGRTYGY